MNKKHPATAHAIAAAALYAISVPLSKMLLDIIAPILLMLGIQSSNDANVSSINSFEIVATSLIALFIFKKAISKRLCTAAWVCGLLPEHLYIA